MGFLQRWYTLPGKHSPNLTDSATFVSESVPLYNKDSTSNNTNVLHGLLTAFDRVEFKDLTQEEIDNLAEYAVFIKSRRKSEK